jgi:hypothetical protein
MNEYLQLGILAVQLAALAFAFRCADRATRAARESATERRTAERVTDLAVNNAAKAEHAATRAEAAAPPDVISFPPPKPPPAGPCRLRLWNPDGNIETQAE